MSADNTRSPLEPVEIQKPVVCHELLIIDDHFQLLEMYQSGQRHFLLTDRLHGQIDPTLQGNLFTKVSKTLTPKLQSAQEVSIVSLSKNNNNKVQTNIIYNIDDVDTAYDEGFHTIHVDGSLFDAIRSHPHFNGVKEYYSICTFN